MAIKILFKRNIFLLFHGQLVKLIIIYAFRIGSVLWLQQETNSPAMAGLFFMMLMLPTAIFGIIGGAIVDRFSRRAIIVYSEFIMAVLMLCIFIAIEFSSNTDFIIVLLFVVAAGIGTVDSVFRPAVIASVPDLVSKSRVEGGFGLLQSCEQIALLIGQLLGGILFGFLGIPLLVLINGLGYLFSGTVGSFIVFPKAENHRTLSIREAIAVYKSEIIEGIRYAKEKKGLRELFLITAMGQFLLAPNSVLLPFYVESTIKAPIEWYGFLIAAKALGTIFGGMAAGSLKFNPKYRSKIVILGAAIMSANSIAISFITNFSVLLFVLIISGMFLGVTGVIAISIIQYTTSEKIRGRITGLFTTLIFIFLPISMGMAGLLADLLNNKVTLVYLWYGILGLSICFLLIFRKGFHQLMSFNPIE